MSRIRKTHRFEAALPDAARTRRPNSLRPSVSKVKGAGGAAGGVREVPAGDPGGSSGLSQPPRVWRAGWKHVAENARLAHDDQVVLGDHDVVAWQAKVAQLHAHPEIAGSIAGTGVGDIVDRLHEGLLTANTLIRSFDVDNEALAALEFGPAPSPVSMTRVEQIANKELTRIEDLAKAQIEKGLRSAPDHPLVRDRKYFALARVSRPFPGDGEVWLALRLRQGEGADPDTIFVHAKLLDSEFRSQKNAIEMLGVNLLHAAYFRPPGEAKAEFLRALEDNLDKRSVQIDFVDLRGPSFPVEEHHDPPPIAKVPAIEVEHVQVGRDRRALQKAQALNDWGRAAGVVAEIGGSQLVAELFRRANRSSRTLFARVSNYGMEMSAHLYGKRDRAVSRERLADMLDREFEAFQERALASGIANEKRLFAFANTVATRSNGQGAGWIGIDFQREPHGPRHRIVLHVRMRSKDVPDQELALKMLGINLIHAAELERLDDPRRVIRALMEGVSPGSLEIDFMEAGEPKGSPGDCGLRLEGWTGRNVGVPMLELGAARSLLYAANGRLVPASEYLYRKASLVLPDRLVDVDENVLRKLGAIERAFEEDPIVREVERECSDKKRPLIRMDLTAFRKSGKVDVQRLWARCEELHRRGMDVLLTSDGSSHALLDVLSESQNRMSGIVLGPGELKRLLDPDAARGYEGGLEHALEPLTRRPGRNVRLFLLSRSEPFAPKSPVSRKALDALRKNGSLVEVDSST